MPTSRPIRAPRQAAIFSAVAGLHAAALALIVAGLVPRLQKPEPSLPVVTALRPPPPAPRHAAPELPAPADYPTQQQPEPLLELPHFEESTATAAPLVRPPAVGDGPHLGVATLHAPSLRQQARLAALVAGCYPSASRRLGEEGRVLARLKVDVSGRASAWKIVESSGFSRLDGAVDCVVRRLAFHPGLRDGEAVAASIDLPVVFRLD
jgi:protein TonB